MSRPTSLGALRKSGYRSRTVKQEMRENLISHLKEGGPVFPGILGYDDTVIPQICNAILSRHDMLLLGLRGQAKTRIIRALPTLLDEWTPILADSDLPDDPLTPSLVPTRRLVEEQGDQAEIRWVHREDRFHEKLATPDVTMADLIGEIDLVKHAEGRHLADENVIHYGLIPRTNRGIFAINELPDLAPRIQVGLFNVLEERDVQIRGFPVRLPLDLFVAFTANPEDYTNRGRIVTPLKDRIGSVIRTHYPRDISHAIHITQENAWLQRDDVAAQIDVPPYMMQIIEEFARVCRESPHINQQSGVSVRASIANAENLVSNAERRCIMHNEARVVPRMCDLYHLSASCRGKVELMLAEDDQAEDKLIQTLMGEAVKGVFEEFFDLSEMEAVVDLFADHNATIEIGDEVPTGALADKVLSTPRLKRAAIELAMKADRPFEDPAELAGAAEFILEALFVNDRITRYAYRGKTFYRR